MSISLSLLFLIVSAIGAGFTFNVYRPSNAGARRGTLSFFAGWLTGELALHQIAWQVLATVGFVAMGALSAWPGWLGLAISFASWGALGAAYLRARQAEWVVEEALVGALGADYRDAILADLRAVLSSGLRWREILLPFPMRDPSVERVREVRFASRERKALHLDLYRPRDREVPPGGRPILLQIHGGAWMVGSRKEQGIPLMLRMAAHGWLCISIDYRLSPRATFPDHLIDVKEAIAWVRRHAGEWGGDPEFVVLTGGSAGGHLASLASLTPGLPEYQPGFEEVDTTVQGCVSFYGVYDFTDRNGVYRNAGLARLLRRWVMKVSLEEARERYEAASPLHRVNAEAPPFFVVHGDRDTLVPVAEARHFVEALRAVSRAPVAYAEIPGAQHAFEIFPSLRSVLAIDGVERFLFHVHSAHLARSQRATSDGIPPTGGVAARAAG